MVEKSIHKWEKIDILVNNAGGGVILPFLEQTPETLKTAIDRNLWTMLWSCYRVLPHMVKQNYGRIINIGADSVRNGSGTMQPIMLQRAGSLPLFPD